MELERFGSRLTKSAAPLMRGIIHLIRIVSLILNVIQESAREILITTVSKTIYEDRNIVKGTRISLMNLRRMGVLTLSSLDVWEVSLK